jgi:hypothetical protein
MHDKPDKVALRLSDKWRLRPLIFLSKPRDPPLSVVLTDWL